MSIVRSFFAILLCHLALPGFAQSYGITGSANRLSPWFGNNYHAHPGAR